MSDSHSKPPPPESDKVQPNEAPSTPPGASTGPAPSRGQSFNGLAPSTVNSSPHPDMAPTGPNPTAPSALAYSTTDDLLDDYPKSTKREKNKSFVKNVSYIEDDETKLIMSSKEDNFADALTYYPYELDSFERIYRSSLALKEELYQTISSNGVLDMVEANKMLLLNPEIDDLYKKALTEGPKMQKLVLPGAEVWSVMLPNQQQLRTVCVVNNQNPVLFLYYLGTNPSTCRTLLLGPKFRSLTIYGNIYNISQPSDIEALVDTLNRFGPQLSALKLDCLHLAALKTDDKSFRVFSRMKTLSVYLQSNQASELFCRHFVPSVQWHQIESLSLKLNFPVHHLDYVFKLLAYMTKLRKLAIEIYYEVKVDERDDIQNYGKIIQDTLRKEARALKCKVEVLKISVQPTVPMLDWDHMTDYRFFLDLFGGAFRETLTKLIIKLPRVVRSEDNILHLQLSNEMYPKLETLVLDYSLYANCDDFPTERNQRLCYRQIGGLKRLIDDDSSANSKAKGIRSLTLHALPKINQAVLRNIARVFPKLVELNIQARNGLVYDTLYDEELLEMLGRLKQLRILRFLDSYPKPDGLVLSIEFMSVRANSLNAPVLVRIPIDLRTATRQFHTFMDAVTEDCQWIQVL